MHDGHDDGHRLTVDREATVVYVTTVLLLIVFDRWAKPADFTRTGWADALLTWLGNGAVPYATLLPYAYWGMASVVLRVLIPLGVILLVLRAAPQAFGFTLRGQRTTVRPYLLAAGLMLPVLWIASASTSFQAKYPLYRQETLGGWHFWGYQLAYGAQFLGVEAFFRGFALFGLARRIGGHAIWIVTIPYVMVHFGKPLPEVFAAVIAGWLLGRWALQSGSFLWGWLLHWTIAVSMDLMVVWRTGGAQALGHLVGVGG
jgi:hypothetical protein